MSVPVSIYKLLYSINVNVEYKYKTNFDVWKAIVISVCLPVFLTTALILKFSVRKDPF
jgi:hypothetical protein